MRILIGMMHPKHVYMFKNFIRAMTEKGHEIKIVVAEKDLTEYLLKKFDLPYEHIGTNYPSLRQKITSIPKWEFLTFKIAFKFKPDIIIGQALPHIAHAAFLLRVPYLLFEDSEPASVVQAFSFSFATTILTPTCYRKKIGEKHIQFNGFLELAYLHPNHFTPSESILTELGLKKSDKYAVLRFVSWSAVHDIGQQSGFNLDMKKSLVHELEKYCRVLITSEGKLPPELEKYQITVSPEKIHDLLSFAHLFVGDSQTMTSEAGILGTPAVRCNSFVGVNDMGNFLELENDYHLIFNFTNPQDAINKAVELIQRSDLKSEWNMKKKNLLSEKIDVSQFMIDFVERMSGR